MAEFASLLGSICATCCVGILQEMAATRRAFARSCASYRCCGSSSSDRDYYRTLVDDGPENERLLSDDEDDGVHESHADAQRLSIANDKASKVLGISDKARKVLVGQQPKQASKMQASRPLEASDSE